MNEIKIFENEQFGKIRTMVNENGETFFVGKDVAEALGYKNIRDAINKHVDPEDKGVAICDTLGGKQELTIINESGLYSLVLSSKLPSAKSFKRWVTSEVLPSIRKTGGYSVPTYQVPQNFTEALKLAYEQQLQIEQLTVDKLVLTDDLKASQRKLKNAKDVNAMLEDENKFRKSRNIEDSKKKAEMEITIRIQDGKIDKLNDIIEEQKPKVDSYDRFINADGTYDIECVSQMLCFKNIGQKNLFKVLRELKILNKDNGPYQKYVNSRYFKVLPKTYKSKITGTYVPYWQTVVYPKGVEYIKKKLIEAGFEFQVNK